MIRFRAFGTSDLRGDDATELRAILTQPRPLALLTYLALARPRGFQRRDTLLALLWPEQGEEAARNALRQTVHRLRKALGDGVLDGRGSGELGLVADRFTTDVVDFEAKLDAGDAAAALDLYRGDLLPGFHISDAPEFERWLDTERDRLKRRAISAAWGLADAASHDGRPADAGFWARRAAELTPDDEATAQRLIRTLCASGDRSGALRAYESFVRRLGEDDDEPSAETVALAASVRSFDAAWPVAPLSVAPLSAAPSPVAPLPAPAAARPPRRRGWYLAAVATVTIVVAMLATRDRLATGARPDARALAVLPFTVRGSPDLRYLAEGMVDLLSAKLDGAAGFRTLDPRSVIVAAKGSDSLQGDTPERLARTLGAEWFVRGDVVEIAGRVQISAQLFDDQPGAHPVATAAVSGDADSLFALVDELTGQILAGQSLGRDTSLTRLAALTTRSLPALKAFLRGEQLMRAGLDAQSAAAFRDAMTLDSAFALAQYRFSVAATWAALPDVRDPTEWARRAAQRAERLPPVARSLLTANLAYRSLRPDSAELLYRAIVDGHPDNVEAWFMLGETLFHFNSFRGRQPMEAWPAFERVLALDPADPHALVHLARLAALAGHADALDSIAQRYVQNHHDAERTIEVRALRAYLRQDSAAISEIQRTLPANGDFAMISALQDIVCYVQDADAAGALALAFAHVTAPNALVMSRRVFADLPLVRAQWARSPNPEEATHTDSDWALETRALQASEPFFAFPARIVRELRDTIAARRTFPARNTAGALSAELGDETRAYLLGLLNARLGDTLRALDYQHQLRVSGSGTGAGAERTRSFVAAIAAAVARAAGDPARAIRALDGFDGSLWPQFPHWGIHERFLLAESLHALGRDDEALPVYESFVSTYDVPWIAPAHFRRGEIQERRGNPLQARFHYARFARLWKDGDVPVRPRVAHADSALLRLR